MFWHLNPAKLQPFKEAYQKKLELEEYARWRSGMYVMCAVGACFGGEYPEQPLGLEQQNSSYADEDEEENYTEEEILRARERFIASLAIQESKNKREKAREERMKFREQQESDSE